ncbi:ribonuclease M5 [Vagococcus acidifermentans]|uniref:Ribonuclease M5 n=1 Tax=Vagococcus acidifermentans TaxID=564710 RepID=A0A430AUM7_9ENTE|nr:ribonuclease M5 [Vagococcus acidifermentans]RSU11762.1 ribonuclease M5 [Vagococcus acidifermentans]
MTIEDKLTIQEIIVVEGKDDTKRIKEVVNADTIETNGSAVSEDVLMQIEHAQEVRGVIIFTDPDFSGEKIRKQVAEVVPDAKHAFISRKKGTPKRLKGSLGVEHASDETILYALKTVVTPVTVPHTSAISEEDLFRYGLIAGPNAKKRRERLGEYLRIGYTNGKQLRKRLAMFAVSREDFLRAAEKAAEEERHGEL